MVEVSFAIRAVKRRSVGRHETSMRRAPSTEVLRALFAHSSNRCAFPSCTQELVTPPPENLFVGQVCHIQGVEPGSARFDYRMSDGEKRGYSNLILLCYPHHVTVDAQPERFSVAHLVEFKRNHESRSSARLIDVSDRVIQQIQSTAGYWHDVIHMKDWHVLDRGWRWGIEGEATASELLASGWEALRYFEMLHKRIAEEKSKVWRGSSSSLFLATSSIPNWVVGLYAYFRQVSTRYLDLFLTLSSPDPAIQAGLTEIREGYRRFLEATKDCL